MSRKTEAKKVLWIRETTGCRTLDCYKALRECDGDKDKAVELLKKKNPLPSWD